jgi:Zn-finger nucleic acid-binding protein
MKCPACGNQLQEMAVSDVTIDVCKGGCGGIWFDNFEMKKFDEPHETAGQELLDIERDESIVIDQTKKRNCPKCDDIVMMRHFSSTKKKVEIDECPNCAGIWLDAGELETIRSLFNSEEEKNAAAQEYLSEVIKGDLTVQQIKDESQAERIQRITKIFRFICPSYYIPGKQSWGAY